MTTFVNQIEPSVVGKFTLKLLSGVSRLTSGLANLGGMRLERTAALSLCPSPCECSKHTLLLPDYSNRKGKTKRAPPVAKSKQAKSKHHMNTLFQYGWTAKEIPMMGQKGQFNKSIFVPRITDQSIHLDGWYVARTRPKNKKFRWSIVHDRTILRHNQSNRPMRFSTPANAIIACEKAALKHRAYHAVIR
jgi:hypothetical protein